MDELRTAPHRLAGTKTRTVKVEVVEGPDAGAQASGEALSVGTAKGNDLVLTDATVSRFHVEVARHEHGVLIVDHDSTNGVHAQGMRLVRAVVSAGTILALGKTRLRVEDGQRVTVPAYANESFGGVRGNSPLMRQLMARAERAAQAEAAVLIVGESGTGKELIARALHTLGPRKVGPFVTVDCGCLAATLVASELFGHERGAFTGAQSDHAGAFERAQGGTLFLDEIGELPLEVQPALLGVLERRRFTRVGGKHEVEVDVRVISATNRDLRSAVNAGGFRLDLYHRIAVATLRVPPLRERLEDLELLVEHFLREAGHAGPVGEIVGPETMAALRRYEWPGNLRELRNFVESSLMLGESPELGGQITAAAPAAEPITGSYKEARARVLHQFERDYLARLIAEHDGNVSKAARAAAMDRSHLIDLLQRHGLR
jgi:DNA-binding NtrC family response regulator